MQLVDIGKTTEGRTELMAIISSEQNMRQLGRFKEIARTLAMARSGDTPLGDAQARALAHDGKAVVWIDFGLHSNEVAHAQTAPLLAFKAVTDESDEMTFIRENVIFLLVPNMNPDGTTLVVNWYMKNVGTPWESRLPELWHKYAGHDDNRDWFMMNQPETRNGARQLYTEWFPEIVYNQHQAAPVPRAHLRAALRRSGEPEHPAARHPRRERGGRRDDPAARSGRQARRDLAHRLRHLVERRHADGTVLPQHDRHPHRNRSRLGDAGHATIRERSPGHSATASRRSSRRRITRARTWAANGTSATAATTW